MADPYGRLDDVFDHGDRRLHPNVFRSPLSQRHEVVEYQVRQTPAGAVVTVRATDAAMFDPAALAADIATGLAGVGLPAPQVTVDRVDALPRRSSGKLVRFVPLGRCRPRRDRSRRAISTRS